ncbi:MAG: hypothetical protein NTZ08_12885, partial [Verrucomicrobia bacterium]|nr:hypothetical protein [Verrucomicrobiota bacterium]
GQPPANFAQAPSGAGCARLATLAFAPPPPEGALRSRRTQLQNKLYTVVSKDSDFVISHLLHNKPGKILIVSTGNIPNTELLDLFKKHLSIIKNAFQDGSYVELSRSYLVVHG